MPINTITKDITKEEKYSMGKSAQYYRDQLSPALSLTKEDYEEHEIARNKLFEGGNIGLKNAIRRNIGEQA